MPITLNGDTGIQTPMYNGTITANAVTPSVNMKNRLINGNFVIDQRNAGASVTIDQTGGTYTLDRWYGRDDSDGAYSIQQVSDAPAGFTNSLKITITTTDSSLSASQYGFISQWIEGFNTADLNWGTANAKTVTLSFWVKGSVTGQFGGSITNSAQNRSYPFSFTISAANTWEQKTVTITGDTTGTWLATNGAGIGVIFAVGVGSNFLDTANIWTGNFEMSATGQTNLYATNGATLFLTGVQLEVGSTATSFDYRPYGTELALCQRYYQSSQLNNPSNIAGGWTGWIYAGANQSYGITNFRVTMRASPTIVLYDDLGNSGAVSQAGVANNIACTASQININGFSLVNKTSGNFTTSYGYPVVAGYTASIEL